MTRRVRVRPMHPEYRLALSFSILAATAYGAGAAEPQSFAQVFIRPECKIEFYGPPDVTRPRPDYVAWDSTHARAFAFKDARTQLVLYVESDGRHLAAIDSTGALLWVRNPFEDQNLCPYRSPRPVIYEIGVINVAPDYLEYLSVGAAAKFKAHGFDSTHKFAKLTFDSSQFGLLDEATGVFFLEGQN